MAFWNACGAGALRRRRCHGAGAPEARPCDSGVSCLPASKISQNKVDFVRMISCCLYIRCRVLCRFKNSLGADFGRSGRIPRPPVPLFECASPKLRIIQPFDSSNWEFGQERRS